MRLVGIPSFLLKEKQIKKAGFNGVALDEFDICVDEAMHYALANRVDYKTALEWVIIERDETLRACVGEPVKTTGRTFGEVYLEQFIDRTQKYQATKINPANQ